MIPPRVQCHSRYVYEPDLEVEVENIGRLGFRVVCIQPACFENPPRSFWITSVKIENYRERIEKEELEQIRIRNLFGPYYNSFDDMNTYKNT